MSRNQRKWGRDGQKSAEMEPRWAEINGNGAETGRNQPKLAEISRNVAERGRNQRKWGRDGQKSAEMDRHQQKCCRDGQKSAEICMGPLNNPHPLDFQHLYRELLVQDLLGSKPSGVPLPPPLTLKSMLAVHCRNTQKDGQHDSHRDRGSPVLTTYFTGTLL